MLIPFRVAGIGSNVNRPGNFCVINEDDLWDKVLPFTLNHLCSACKTTLPKIKILFLILLCSKIDLIWYLNFSLVGELNSEYRYDIT